MSIVLHTKYEMMETDQLIYISVVRFPADEISALLSRQLTSVNGTSDQAAFSVLTGPLQKAILPYTKSRLAGVPGSERALQCFLSLLRKWVGNERWFCDGKTYADAVDTLRKSNKNDSQTVLAICRAHERLTSTSEIVIRIISIIGDGTRIDFDSGATSSAIGKRVSPVAGAEGLALAMPVVSEIGSMGPSDEYSEVALRARKLLMQESMPSLEQRKQNALAAANALAISMTCDLTLPREVETILAERIPIGDVVFPLLTSLRESKAELGLMELYLRQLYRPYTLKEFERDEIQRLVRFSFLNKPSEAAINAASVNSMSELGRILSSGSLSNLSERSVSDSNFLTVPRISENTLRTGSCVIIDNLNNLTDEAKVESVLASFPQFTGRSPRCESGPPNLLYFVILSCMVGADDEDAADETAKQCEAILKPFGSQLEQADIRRVSFVFNQELEDEFQHDFGNALFTFRSPEFHEDSLYRSIDPSLSSHLHLNRVAANFWVKSLGSRHTSTCHVHLYKATPKSSALAKDKKANKLPRVFARTLSFSLEFSSSGFERVLVDSLNALDLSPLKSRLDNHLFLNLVSDFERTVLDPVVVEQVVVDILKRHSERISALGLVEVETRIVCCLNPDSPPIAIRLFASNPTGYVQVMNTYVEAASPSSTERIFKLVSGTKASLASVGDSSWDGLKVNTPYPLTRPFDAQRKAALQSSDTIYCYDIPALFEAAVEQQWLEASDKGIEGGTGRPLMVMYTTELVVKRKGDDIADKWTIKDYLAGRLELTHATRRAGANDVGMVAWLVTLKTVEYPKVRSFTNYLQILP